MTKAEKSGLSGTDRAGFFRRIADYWIAPYTKVVVTPYRVVTPKLRPGQDLTIAFVSDLHADIRFMPEARLREVVAATNALGADLICVGGDMSAQHNWAMTPLPVEQTVEILSDLKAPLGVFAVLGNHDWWDDPRTQAENAGPPAIAGLIRNSGMRLLTNAARKLDHPSGAWIAGLDSQHAFERPRRRHEGAHDLEKTLADIPAGALGILLAHEPDIFAELVKRPADTPVDVVLSGHTHGGQIRVFRRRPVVPSTYGERYAYGHSREACRDLIVSGGLGCSKIPLRFGVTPEIVLIMLRAE